MSSIMDRANAAYRAPRDAHAGACGCAQSSAAVGLDDGHGFLDDPMYAQAFRFVPRRVMAGSDIVAEGGDSPACVAVKTGWAAPYKLLRDGRRQLLDLLMDQDGIRVCRDGQGRAFHSIVALTDCFVLEGAADDLARFGALQRDGEPCAETIFAEQQRRMMDRMAILGHGRAAERLASCLLDLWRRQEARGNVDEAGSCPILIRQSDLGDAVGLTAVHVCRTLTVFRRLGLLEFANGRLKILRPEKVAFIAGADGDRQFCEI
jgi:CRP-like cAMP-binding protein